MTNYLGEFNIDINDTDYADYTPKQWALLWIMMHGGTDGSHHKHQVLDDVVKILTGGNVIVKEAKWSDGQKEFRFEVEATAGYNDWIEDYEQGGEYQWLED